MMKRRGAAAGITLIELMIVIVVVGALAVLAGPSFVRMIDAQRVRSINAEVASDMQFARSEAVARGAYVRVTFRGDATQTCYSIYSYTNNATFCDCLNTPACAASDQVEIKTVRFPLTSWFRVRVEPAQGKNEFAFDPVVGALYEIPTDFITPPLPQFGIRTQIDAARAMRVFVGLSGRVSTCRTSASQIQGPAC